MNTQEKLLQSIVAQLGEHFDTVQIFVTSKDEDSTNAYHQGVGNWYARYGHVKAWLRAEERDFKKVNNDL